MSVVGAVVQPGEIFQLRPGTKPDESTTKAPQKIPDAGNAQMPVL